MIAILGSVLLASLLGSPHCAGMCGGFVAFYSGADPRPRFAPHLAYSAGRLVSYVALGLIAGALGSGVDRLGTTAGVGRIAAVLAGAFMVAWGGATLARAAGVRVPPLAPAALHRPLGSALRAVREQPAWRRGLVTGLVTTLLPCGWLYAFVALAGGTARPLAGALVMLVFWMGTLPMMVGLGLMAQSALGPLARRLPLVTAALLVIVGLMTVAGKFRPMAGMGAGMPAMSACAPAAAPPVHGQH